MEQICMVEDGPKHPITRGRDGSDGTHLSGSIVLHNFRSMSHTRKAIPLYLSTCDVPAIFAKWWSIFTPFFPKEVASVKRPL